jgi:hypothetical protein
MFGLLQAAALSLVAAASTSVVGAAQSQPIASVSPTTTVAPTPTTIAPTVAPLVTAVAPTTTSTAPTTAKPVTRPATTPTTAKPLLPPVVPHVVDKLLKEESCGWGWDAYRVTDGSVDEVDVQIQAPHRPNAAVVITAQSALPGALPVVHATTTDADGNASAHVPLTEDRRGWTLTLNATFGTSSCAPRTFTISY